MTPIKLNRAPLTKRISALAIAVTAALSFSVLSPTAEAAPLRPTKEYLALQAALPQGVLVEQATAAQLAQALEDAVENPLNARLKPGNIAGEALKYAGTNGQDAGDEIGARLVAVNGGDDLLAARDAIKRAGSGKDINVSLVPDFATVFITSTGAAGNTEAFKLAGLVKSSKVGAGAVIAGRASELETEIVNPVDRFNAQVALVNSALAPLKSNGGNLKGAALEVTKFVVAEVDAQAGGAGNTADFTLQVAKTALNIPIANKIGTGGVAGDPTNGGPIVDALLDEATLPKLKAGIAGFVKTVATVADIEEISHIAVAIGEQMGIAAGTTTAIKFSSATAVVTALAKAIVAKSTSADPVRNSATNKQDETAEVAAFMVGHMFNTLTINGAGGGRSQVAVKAAGAKVLAVIKAAVNAAKGAKVASANGASFFGNVAADVAGSVAETLERLNNAGVLPQAYYDSIKTFLLSKAGAIAGPANTQAVTTALNDGFTVGSDPNLEEGTPANVAQATTADPETDFRPFTP